MLHTFVVVQVFKNRDAEVVGHFTNVHRADDAREALAKANPGEVFLSLIVPKAKP